VTRTSVKNRGFVVGLADKSNTGGNYVGHWISSHILAHKSLWAERWDKYLKIHKERKER